jgi:hypothetical protein
MKCLTENASLIIHVEEGVKHTYCRLDKKVPPDELLAQITELHFTRNYFIAPLLKTVVLPLLGKLCNLEYLSFHTCDKDEFYCLLDMLKNNPHLVTLKIEYMYGHADIRAFNHALVQLKHLRHLKVGGVASIDVSNLHGLFSFEGSPRNLSSLNGFVHLERLNLHGNVYDGILDLIRSCEKLQELTLYSVPLKKNEEEALEVNYLRNRKRQAGIRRLLIIAKKGNRDVIHEIIKNLRI